MSQELARETELEREAEEPEWEEYKWGELAAVELLVED
jgi:hypothetical protein